MTLQTSRDLAITTLAYEKINDQYYKAKYLGLECIMDMKTGYINATKFCASSDKSKRFANYIRSDRYKNLFDYIKSSSQYRDDELSIQITGGINVDLRGTYLHPDLLLDLSSWISPAAYIRASQIVKNVLVREKEDEIRALTGDKSRLEKMFEEEKIERREAEKRAEEMLLKMTLQNEKTHITLETTNIKLDNTTKTLEKAEIDNAKIKTTLKRVETRIDLIVDEIVPPARQVSLHEQFGVMKLNDPTNSKQYKVYCSQKRGVAKAKSSILKSYPNAVMFKEVTPNANAKNFLHILKEKYGSTNSNSKIRVSYNFINLKSGVLEEELNTMINEVVERAKNYGK
jgi:hypothetical protein